MKERDLSHVGDISMFNEKPFNPITNEPIRETTRMKCTTDTRYETGMILCTDEGKKPRIGAIIVAVIAVIVASLFLFSIKVEIKNLDDIDFVGILIAVAPIIVIIILSATLMFAITRAHR